MSFDYSGMEQLASQVKGLAQGYDSFINGFILKMALRALAMTKDKTTVISGTLRRNWQITGVQREGDIIFVELFNPMEYSSYVEDGHRRVAGIPFKLPDGSWRRTTAGWTEGKFMAELSVQQIEREMPMRYEEAFKKFVASLGGETS